MAEQHHCAEEKGHNAPAVNTPCVGEKTSTMNKAIASPINTAR